MIGLQESINGLNEYIGALEGAIGASSFAIAGGIPNPGSRVNGGEISGGTFTTDGGVHSSLGGELIGMNEYIGSSGVLGVSGGALTHGSAEYNNIRGTGVIGAAIGNKLERVKDTVNERVQNVLTLQSVLDNTFDNLLSNLDTSGDLAHAADIENVRFVKDKINEALNNETQALQKLLQTTIKPSSESIKDLVKKNATFAALADSLGVDYDTDEGSDRLAIAYTNLSNTGLAVEKVKHALKTLEMTVNEYSQLRNSKDLENKLTKILKTVNKPAVKSKLSKILDAIQILRNSQYNHKNVIECLKDDKKCLKTGYGEESSGAFDTHATGAFDIGGENEANGAFDIEGENDIDGGALTSNSIGRVKKFKTKSTLSRNIKTYEKTLKELFKSFMNQVHTNFKEIQKAVENVADEIGQFITYDEKIKNFVNIFESLGQDTNNNKLFYALIVFDDSIASREIKTRFLTNLDKLIESLDELKQYKYLNEVKRQLESLKENIDTYTDTVTGFKNNEVKVKEGEKEGSSDFYWTNKILDQSVTLNVSQLIKDTITKLKFYGNVSQMKSSLNSTLNEFVSYKEDYDKLLGKSIGTKINELTTEYNENIDRLENIKCNRGRQLLIYNTTPANANAQLPKGLVKTIYTLQYEAKLGLYKTIEAIDLYLMNFTELLSSNIEATKELNKMLQQTEVISKWYNKNSADKLFKLMEKVIYTPTTATNRNTTVNDVRTFITGQTIKEVLELCKDSIDSVSMLKNMLSMFVHIGDKFGDSKVSSKTYMSPNIMYKNLFKYIWVSAFTMGYGTGGGDATVTTGDTITDPHYTKETGDKASHFNVHFTQLVQSRQQSTAILGGLGEKRPPPIEIPDDITDIEDRSIKSKYTPFSNRSSSSIHDSYISSRSIPDSYISFSGSDTSTSTISIPDGFFTPTSKSSTISIPSGFLTPSSESGYSVVSIPSSFFRSTPGSTTSTISIPDGFFTPRSTTSTVSIPDEFFTPRSTTSTVSIPDEFFTPRSTTRGPIGGPGPGPTGGPIGGPPGGPIGGPPGGPGPTGSTALPATDIFETDDVYFVLVMKAITAKILTVIGTAHILRQPKTVVGLITNPVRSIIGAASKDPEIIDDAFELYIRLPLLVEFYKKIFEDGNQPYKRNQNANNATETIAYIPEIGSIWSGLIQCIFDESRYIKDGIYSINNMKRIIAEVNHIYQNYKNVDKNKLVRTAVLDLVADVNKRYGVLKKQEIDEFYQIKKKYVKNPAGSTGVNHVNFDILDENNEFEDLGPSSKYTENIFSKSMNEKVLTNDIQLVKEFHNKIHAELFSQKTQLKNLDKKSFTEKIRFYRNELNNADNKKKLEIIIKAIDDSSNINSHNDDASVLFHELVVAPIKNLQAVREIINYIFYAYLPRLYQTLNTPTVIATARRAGTRPLPANPYQGNLDEYNAIANNIDNAKYPGYARYFRRAGNRFNKITLIEFFFSYLSDIDNLVSIKFISKNKFIIDHSKLQNAVETSIENIKYMISKFRSVLSESVIKKYEECLLALEDHLLLKMLNSDDNNDDALYDLCNFDYLNSSIAIILDDTKDDVLQGDLYKAIMFRQADKSTSAPLSIKGTNMKIWDDIFAQYGGARNKIWIPIHRLTPPAAAAVANNNFNHLERFYNNLNNLEDSSILYGFNSLIYEYLCTFYDASTKKIYNNLFNEFVNKSQSSVIFGRKGIPDINSNDLRSVPSMPRNLRALADSLFIENDYILCESLGYMFKTIVNRTTNVQIPTKNHLLTSLSEVSPNFIEKYKVYLPVFIKLFETLIHKSLLCKKVLETTDTSSTGTDLINNIPPGTAPAADFMTVNTNNIEGDVPGDIQSFNTRWAVGTDNSKVHFNNTLNSIIEASRAMINDATNVLAEINVKQQFFELKENFIKNYYNNNNTLPLMPLSLNTVILHDNIFRNGTIVVPLAPYTLIPYPNKLDNEFKLLYGMNSVINNKALDNSINSYIWLKEELKNYNNSSLSINKIDVAKVNDYIEMNNKLTISLASIIHYNQFLNETKTNNQFIYINPTTLAGTAPVPCDYTDTYYTQLNAQSVLNEALDSVDNTSLANTKNKISNIIKQSNTTLDISRVNARFLNILDLNIVPLNIHALMREIPLTNIYNYAFTYDHIVKQLFQKDYDYNISNPANCDDILLKLFLNPYFNQCGNSIELVNALVSTNNPPNNSMNNKLGRSKYISDILSHALGAGFNNGTAAPVSLSQFNYTDKSRNNPATNQPPYTENEIGTWAATLISMRSISTRIRLDNKYLRNLIFLTNLQRLIHYKIKHEVEIINSKVVSDMAITNSQIVNYDDVDHPNLEETDFEYFAED